MFDVQTLLGSFRSFARLNLDHIEIAEINRLQRSGTIIVNPARRRPRYFDGRFLAAHDLTREQDYFLERQADLARATGPGIAHGLMVTRVDDTRVKIQSGNGVTPAGDLVVLRETLAPDGSPADLIVDLADAARMMELDRAFNLDVVPNEPPRRRTGLFVLALRPVEFTANPIAAYPTSVTERRSVDDGEIIEGVAVTLVPYRDDHTEIDPLQQRAQAARRIFVEGAKKGVPLEALPIAMLQLDRGFIMWIDPHMVRREIGAEHAGAAGFGLVPRGQREAFVHQQEAHLLDVMADRENRAGALRFPAAEVFRALPPAGQLPVQAIERIGNDRYSQIFFPPQMPCVMAMVPDDEVSTLVDEALLMPPIDLTVPQEDLAFTQIVVLLPVPRWEFSDGLMRSGPLSDDVRRISMRLEPATPGVLARRQPIDVFRKLSPRMPSTMLRERAALPVKMYAEAEMVREVQPITLDFIGAYYLKEYPFFFFEDARWGAALERTRNELGGRLWYVRARTLQWRVIPTLPDATNLPAPYRDDESHPISAMPAGSGE
jgi:hypothetical protein